ncbi:amidoligase family protein [Thomasclavelia cocleata]|uniref:amidoligase family protein n=1 Tax=Thomasclavelia cocleata TaxID=69824 RepID=UPI00241E24A5|nr:amidoligase family protein [Thomasclavelia cocleata]
MKNQRFGIEIEMTGLTRKRASEIVAMHFESVSEYEGGSYRSYSVKDTEGRKWKVVYDSSITPQIGSRRISDIDYKVELVSPICRYDDIEDIQQIVRKLRKDGHAKVNDSCGIHIHVDASPHDARSLRNITNIMYSKEELIYKALQVQVARERRYCQKVEESFIQKLNKSKPKDLNKLKSLWYNGDIYRSRSHYDNSRYHALNLHSVFQKGTIEFRLFNGTLHAGEIKSYIQFCLAISHQALTQSKASRRKTHSTNEKYTFRTWLLRLGLIGNEFKTARHHLLKNLDGCIAWKDPNQAIAQKERLKAQREQQTEENQLEHESENFEMSVQQR